MTADRVKELERLLNDAYHMIYGGPATPFARQHILDRIDRALGRPTCAEIEAEATQKIGALMAWCDETNPGERETSA
jgi:hypothetical protein